MKASEGSVKSAIQDYRNDVFTSQNAAAEAYGVPISAFRSHLNGSSNQAIAQRHLQRLSSDQEEFLFGCILDEDARGCPPSYSRTREMVCETLIANRDKKPLGNEWITSFLRRNPRVHSIIGRKIEACRSNVAKFEDKNIF